MEDYTSNVLNDLNGSKNEWSILLLKYTTPYIIEGFRSIFNEALEICEKNDEVDKYLMTYQNLLSRIPNWNQTIIENEKDRIIKTSKCSFLEDLITGVHILQLKLLSCVNVSSEPKKIEINIPDLSLFLHKVYINIARKLYSNIYLFELDIQPLEQQKRNREFEILVQICIMNTIRDNLPVEELLRKYIDETQEIDVKKIESMVEKEIINEKSPVTILEEIPQVNSVPVISNPVINSPIISSPMNDVINNKTDVIINDKPASDLNISWDPGVIDNENKTENNSYEDDNDIKLNIGEEIKLDLDLIDEDQDIKLDIEEI